MPGDIDDEPPASRAIANGWEAFEETVLPSITGNERAKANAAFHFGAMYVLQILEQVVKHRSAEAAAVALSTLGAELEEYMDAHALTTQ